LLKRLGTRRCIALKCCPIGGVNGALSGQCASGWTPRNAFVADKRGHCSLMLVLMHNPDLLTAESAETTSDYNGWDIA
jgi:hypothetical protein